jgi:hypothetical protein
VAYLPQILKAAADKNGASAISYTTWSIFLAAHLSTVAYALINRSDWGLAACFAGNAVCCATILAVACWKHREHAKRAPLSAGPQLPRCDDLTAPRSNRGQSPASIPASRVFADADLNSAYAALATRFPEETFTRAPIGGADPGKLQAGLVTALLAAIILTVARNFS